MESGARPIAEDGLKPQTDHDQETVSCVILQVDTLGGRDESLIKSDPEPEKSQGNKALGSGDQV